MKSLLVRLSVLTLGLAAGCSTTPLGPTGSVNASAATAAPDDPTSDENVKEDGQCVRRHRTCQYGGTACCTGFCQLTGYISGTCVGPQANGASCEADAHCKSGVCKDYVCVAAVCAPTGGACKSSGDCCVGSCNAFSYVSASQTCVAPLANGASCALSRDCQSGICQDYTCVATACAAVGLACKTDGDCCGGNFCNNLTYAPWRCTAPQADGAWCERDAECKSGKCTDYQCAHTP